MLITWFLIIIFLIAILLEMGFLGRYISITQNIFNNRTLASFTLGSLTYFLLTFIVFFPFIWVKPSQIWFVIILFIKDALTVIFLINRRNIIKNWKFDGKQVSGIIGIAVVLPIFYYFGLSKWFDLIENPNDKINTLGGNTWAVYNIWVDSFSTILNLDDLKIKYFLIAPIVSMILFASVGSLFFAFTKKSSWSNVLIVLVTTFLIAILFNMNIDLYYLMFLPFIIFMVQCGYNILMFSRRRYGTFFGVASVIIWTINPLTFWVSFFLALTISFLYIILRKRRPSIFIIQLMSPLLIILGLLLSDVSLLLSFFLTIFAFATYSLIFFFGRNNWVELTNIVFTYLRYIWLLLTIMIIVVAATCLTWFNNSFFEAFVKNNGPFNNFDNSLWSNIQNGIYYLITAIIIVIWSINFLKGKKLSKEKLLLNIALVLLLISFNPFMQMIFKAANSSAEYAYLKLSIYPILIIISFSYLV